MNQGQTSSDFHAKKILQLIAASSAGIAFGFASEKAKVFSPMIIREQMEFTRFIMLKMFLSAAASSSLTLAIMSLMTHFEETRKNFASASLQAKKPIAVIVGAVILGAGMTLAGSCPGMVLVQIGSGTSRSILTVAGCFCGALLYGIVEPKLRRFATYADNPKKELWLDSMTGIKLPILALGLAGTLAAIVISIERAIPWTEEVPALPARNPLLSVYWSPILSGVILGMLQLPISLALSETIGGSSAYCTLLSKAIPGSIRNSTLQYFKPFSGGIQNWWQVIYVLSGVTGAAISAVLSDSWGSEVGVGSFSAFLGGALMLFGARLASGCTSGHGISGMGLLYATSFLAVPAMFGGGIITALGIKRLS